MASSLPLNNTERQIVLFGRTGSGKSTSGNNILGKKAFKSKLSSLSVTKKCQRGTASLSGRSIQIIDTPGLFDTYMTKAEVCTELIKCIGMTAPGPHAFVLVVRLDTRFTEEEQATVQQLKDIFGETMVKWLIILFTRKDELIKEEETLEEYLETVPETLKTVLSSCRGYMAINNRATGSEMKEDVQQFLGLVERVVRENGGQPFNNEMYEAAEKQLREREDAVRRQQDEQHQRKLSDVQREHELQISLLNQNTQAMERKNMQLLNMKRDYDDMIKLIHQKYVESLDYAIQTERNEQRDEILNEEPGKFDIILKGVAMVLPIALSFGALAIKKVLGV